MTTVEDTEIDKMATTIKVRVREEDSIIGVAITIRMAFRITDKMVKVAVATTTRPFYAGTLSNMERVNMEINVLMHMVLMTLEEVEMVREVTWVDKACQNQMVKECQLQTWEATT